MILNLVSCTLSIITHVIKIADHCYSICVLESYILIHLQHLQLILHRPYFCTPVPFSFSHDILGEFLSY